MPRLIDAETSFYDIYKMIEEKNVEIKDLRCTTVCGIPMYKAEEVFRFITKHMPTADEGVRKAFWTGIDTCSECGNVDTTDYNTGFTESGMYHRPPFCMWCGAKMVNAEMTEVGTDGL